MNAKIMAAREEYIENHELYDGDFPNGDSSNISDEDLKLHACMRAVKEIKDLRETNKAKLESILSSVDTIKNWVSFWSILSIVAAAVYILIWLSNLDL